jgi:hypothetical protein
VAVLNRLLQHSQVIHLCLSVSLSLWYPVVIKNGRLISDNCKIVTSEIIVKMFVNHLMTAFQLHYTQNFRLYLTEKTRCTITKINRLMLLGKYQAVIVKVYTTLNSTFRKKCSAPECQSKRHGQFSLGICDLLGHYAVSNSNPLPTFRYNVSVPFSRIKFFLDYLILEDGTDNLSRKVGKR